MPDRIGPVPCVYPGSILRFAWPTVEVQEQGSANIRYKPVAWSSWECVALAGHSTSTVDASNAANVTLSNF